MIGLGEHADFIIWAYVGVFAALALLTGWTAWAALATRKRLAALEANRPDRRS